MLTAVFQSRCPGAGSFLGPPHTLVREGLQGTSSQRRWKDGGWVGGDGWQDKSSLTKTKSSHLDPSTGLCRLLPIVNEERLRTAERMWGGGAAVLHSARGQPSPGVGWTLSEGTLIRGGMKSLGSLCL